jgi:flavodoxin
MRTLILVESKFGNTAHLAQAIADELAPLGPTTVVNVDGATPSFEGIELLVVCGPTHAHGVSAKLKVILDELPQGALDGIAAAAFDTRVKGPRWLTGAASVGIAKRLQKKGARLIVPAESFIVAGSEGPLGDDELAHARTWAAALKGALAPSMAVPV